MFICKCYHTPNPENNSCLLFGISVNFKGRKKHLREEKVKMATVNDDAMIFYQDMFIYSGK